MTQEKDNLKQPVPPVVVVDDDDQLRRAVVRLLAAHGLASLSYSSAEQFLADAPAAMACLVLDIDLPGMSGIALYRTLCEGAAPAAVFITGSSDTTHAATVAALGATALLTKPFDGAALIGAVKLACQAQRA